MAHSIGKTIAELRKQKGWTQVELAEKLQVSDKAVSKWEKDDAFPSIEFFPMLGYEIDLNAPFRAANFGNSNTDNNDGIISKEYLLPETTTQDELLALVNELNDDDTVNGILCQLPLPKGLDEKIIIEAIDPNKDVDAFHPVNVGRIMIGDYDFLPCTPAGVMEMLSYYNIDINGKECVVIGRSNIVGKPMSMLLLHKNGTVTIAHSRTKNLNEVTRRADILVAAVGRANFVTADMVKDGAVVIDVGINRVDGKLCGDVDFDAVSQKASYITPVPGGVGPMTIATLMQNTLTAAKRQNNLI